jgi:hypothetical protein
MSPGRDILAPERTFGPGREVSTVKAYMKPACDKVELFKELTLSCKLL